MSSSTPSQADRARGSGTEDVPFDPTDIVFSENLSPEQRQAVANFATLILRQRADAFAYTTGRRLVLTEVDVRAREEDGKMHANVLFEVDVGPDMLNPGGIMHGGCAMTLVDVCSFIALVSLSIAMGGKGSLFVSQTINTVFHAPCTTGSRLRIINKTTAFGARTVSARVEIWDITHRRLIVSGAHSMMLPSASTPPPPSRL